jgi:hypothetical protein
VIRLGVQKAPLKRSVFKLFLKNLEATRIEIIIMVVAFNSLFSSPCYMLKMFNVSPPRDETISQSIYEGR